MFNYSVWSCISSPNFSYMLFVSEYTKGTASRRLMCVTYLSNSASFRKTCHTVGMRVQICWH